MSRKMQMDETCKKLGAANMPDEGQGGFGGAPMGGPPMGGPPVGGPP